MAIVKGTKLGTGVYLDMLKKWAQVNN